ncbi:hypothetical protein BCR39DRAFT_599108 [Naematelia encephala]|uniref:SUR7/PalI family-domain-containing protein n=1 Tax=Naematelia encephala TaxID=71784 RepID=A0A1Y2AZY2_9TREE|nr:hypothetical protein BCR39DRAFT_599108 [Naematelia encephala]
MAISTRLRDSRPTRTRPLIAWHTLSVLLGALTALFLILSGLTGPSTEYWWLDVTVSGTTWNFGGLGACPAGQSQIECSSSGHQPPGDWDGVKNDLRWHIAFGIMLVFAIVLETTLILHRPHRAAAERLALWTNFLLPLMLFGLGALTLGIDFAVVGHLKSRSSAQDVRLKPSFWLTILALIGCASWTFLSLYLRQVAIWTHAEDVVEKEPTPEPWTLGGALRSLWPWGTGKAEPADDAA